MPTPSDLSRAPRALIVDDDEVIVELYDKSMTHLGFQTFKAFNGRQALDVFCRVQKVNAIDIVVSGIYMPIMNGLKLGKAIRKMEPHIPMIAMSGNPGLARKAALDSRSGGFDVFLEKPITWCHFQHAVLTVAMKHNSKRIIELADFDYLWIGPKKEL